MGSEVSGYYIPNLYESFPDDVRSNRDVIDQCIGRCSSYGIKGLYKLLPDDVKKCDVILNRFIEKSIDKCPGQGRYLSSEGLGALFKLFPEGLFVAFPDDLKRSVDVCRRFASRCTVEQLP